MRHTSNVQKIKTHILCHIYFSKTLYHLYDMWKTFGTAKWAIDDNVVQHLCVECWTTEATHIQNNTAFPWQQRLLQCAPMLHYMYNVYLLVS